MGREAASESHGRGRLSGAEQPKDARRRQRRPLGGPKHRGVVSSVIELPLISNLASIDSKFTSLLQLLVGPATRPERVRQVGHQLRATGDFIRLTGEGRWWYVMDEGLAARGWRQQNYCGRCSGPQHKQSSDRRRLAWAVIGRRGGAHASNVTGIERKASCVPRSSRAEKQSAASFGRRRAAARAAEAPPWSRKPFPIPDNSCPLEPTPCEREPRDTHEG